MRLPYEKYTRFLVTCGLTYEDAAEQIRELNLPPPTKEEWEALYLELTDSNLPKTITNYWVKGGKIPKDFLKYMRDVGLLEAWLYNAGKNPDFKQMIEVAQNPDTCDRVKALLMKKAEADEVASVAKVSERAIYLFKEYLWDTSILFKRDWIEFWHRLGTPGEQKLFLDVFRGSPDEVRLLLGLPTRISYLTSLQEMHVRSMIKFREYLSDRRPDSDKMALNWSKLALAAGDRHEKNRMRDLADFGKELQLSFDFVETEFPSMNEVVAGK